MDKEEFRRRFISKTDKIDSNKVSSLKQILSGFFDQAPIAERAYLFYNSLSDRPVCLCGGKVKFISFAVGYNKECAKCKRKSTCMERLGVENPTQSKEILARRVIDHVAILEKSKRTNLLLRGVEFPFQDKNIRDKASATHIQTLGVSHPFKSKEILQRATDAKIDKYGTAYPAKLDSVKDKTADTCMSRYGVKTTLLVPEIKHKIDQSNEAKFGTAALFKSPLILRKIENTNLEKLGAKNPFSSKKFITQSKTKTYIRKTRELSETHELLFTVNQYIDSKSIKDEFLVRCKACLHEYMTRIKNGGPTKCPICFPKSSEPETQLFEYISSIVDDTPIRNSRNIIPNYEIDIFLPRYNIGFEMNGIYWHSEDKVGKNYHIDKSDCASRHGIKLVHIFEDEWVKKDLIVKKELREMLVGMPQIDGIVDIKLLDEEVAIQFTRANSLSKVDKADLYYGLVLGGKLIYVLSLRKISESKWEIVNTSGDGYSSPECIRVVLDNFIQSHSPDSITAFSSRLFDDGNRFLKLGFGYCGQTNIDSFYVHPGRFERSYEYVERWMKIWDCGQNVWVWKP